MCFVLALRNTCNEINECNTRRSRSMTSLVSRSSRRMSLTSTCSRSSGSSGISSGSSTGSSVDCEVLDIQTRLVFPEHVQAFQLATATRHMIYSGDLTHIDDPICTKVSDFVYARMRTPSTNGNNIDDDDDDDDNNKNKCFKI